MRFARALAGMLLLVIGIAALVAGGALWVVARYADPDGDFHARFEPVRTTGHAVVVTDVAGLLRRDAPFVRAGSNRLRLSARTADGPAFLGLAPTAEVRRWLGDAPYATVGRVAVTRGALPVRLDPVDGTAPAAPPAGPIGRAFWVREGIGVLEWDPAEFDDRSLSLVLMRPDGRADVSVDVRADLRAAWLTPARWALPPAGVLLAGLAVLLLGRPPRPREVVFVVEPDQVPVLARRLGVTSLSALGAPPVRPAATPTIPAERPLVAVGAVAAGRPAIGPAAAERSAVSAGRPRTLADLDTDTRQAGEGRSVRRPDPLVWPPLPAEGAARPTPEAAGPDRN